VSDPITPAGPPAEITHLVRERMEARTKQDWTRADALKEEIEQAGWKVVDRGSKTSVTPAAPASVEIDGQLRYGNAAAVPSLLAEPAAAALTVVIVASEAPAAVSRLLTGLRDHSPAGTQVVVVANDPSAEQEAALSSAGSDTAPIGESAPEVLRTSRRLAIGTALNIGLKRAAGDVIVLADGSAWPTGDALSPLVDALRDPAVAVVGGFGLTAAQPGPIQPTGLERSDDASVVALEAAWIAFRRADLIELGPLDERFVIPAWLDVWWSLRLRAGKDPEFGDDSATGAVDETEVAPPEVPLPAPRKALRLELPLGRDQTGWPPDRSRMARRNMYRVLNAFGWRDDLA
jgi:hypothetical protein